MKKTLQTLQKAFFFVFLMVLGAQISLAQTPDSSPYNSWRDLLPQNKEANFFEIRDAFNTYWKDYDVKGGYYFENGIKKKAPSWKPFKRWEYYWQMRVNPQTGEFPTTTAFDELKKMQSSENQMIESASGNWTNLGVSASGGGYAGIGRINVVAFHPTDNNTFWIGSPAGGLWRTTNGGASWTVLTDQNDVLGVSGIAVNSDYNSSHTIYIATGDRDGGSMWSLGGGQSNDNNSIGVLKSTDGGTTWNTTGLTWSASQKKKIGRLLIDPNNNQTLYAATSDGIYKTTNGGTNWTFQQGGEFIDMEFKPDNPNTIYAVTSDYWGSPTVYKTTNGGSNWSSIYTFSSDDRRGEIAVSANDPQILYVASSERGGGLGIIIKSTNAGSSFTQMYDGDVSGHSLLGYYCNGSGSNSGQGGYDFCMAADPTNADILFLGGVNTSKSVNGGSTWSSSNVWTSSGTYNPCGSAVVHADKHFLAFQNNTSTLFETNDGGVYRTNNGGTTWTDLTNGIVISQIYRLGVSQTLSNEVIIGLQDNGTKLLSAGSWTDHIGGDGMECMIDYADANTQYGTYVNGELYRTTNHWASSSEISTNIPGGAAGHWVSPYIIDPVSHETIYVGYANVWKSTNKGSSFTQISTMSTGDKLRAMAIAPSNNQVLYVADPDQIWRTTNGGTSWTDITGTLPTGNSITYLAVKADDPNTVWVTFGGYGAAQIYESTNAGSTWTNISAGLPNIPAMCVVQNKLSTSNTELYIGTDVGVYVKIGTDNWTAFNTGLPNVVVSELDIYYNGENSRLRAATFGRGLWESDLWDVGNNPNNFVATPTGTSQINLSWQQNSSNHDVMVAWSADGNFGTPADGTSYSDGASIGSATVLYTGSSLTFNHTALSSNTTYYYKAWSVDGSTNYSSGVITNATTDCGNMDLPFTEDFEATTFPPACWTSFIGTNGLGTAQNWESTTSAHNGARAAFVRYENVSGGTAEDWLVSPLINLQNASTLKFFQKQEYSTDYGTRFYIKVSTTSQTNPAQFTNVVNYGEGTFGTSYTEKTVNLSTFDNRSVYIAFVMVNDDGDSWFIDDVSITGTAAVTPTASISTEIACETGTVIIESDQTAVQTFYLLDENEAELDSWTGNTNAHEFTGLNSGTYKGKVQLGTETSAVTAAAALNNDALVVADAGEDQTICVDYTNLDGNNLPQGATGEWSLLSGCAIISDYTLYNTLVSGICPDNTFRWTITNGTCISIDEVLVSRISDTQAPVITCAADVYVNNDNGLCEAAVTLTAATATDDCVVQSITNNHASNTYPVGTTTVTWTATDGSDNTASCQQQVNVSAVNDTQVPVITCAADVYVANDSGMCEAAVTLTVATATDDCVVQSITNDHAGNTYPVGTTTVTWTATDGGGNTASCQQQVNVSGVDDTQAPVITCAADVYVNNDNGLCEAAVTLTAATATDDCVVQSITNDHAGNTYPVGITTVTWTATDGGGNTASCQQQVSVTDTESPVISCATNVSVNNGSGVCEATVNLTAATATDNCSIQSITNDHASTTYPVGTSTVVWTATDMAGNTVSCQQQVNVTDTEIPVISCASNVSVNNTTGFCRATVSLTAATATDNCAVQSVTNDHASTTYPVGTSTVIWTTTDTAGNTASCQQQVSVTDKDAPVIICATDVYVNNDTGICGATVNLTSATAADNCSIQSVTKNHAGNVYPVGITTVTWTATDINGNVASCQQRVTVSDTENPAISCAADVASCENTVTVLSPTVSDNCGVVSTLNDFNGTADASGTYPLGETTVNWTVVDVLGNINSCSQKVNINKVAGGTSSAASSFICNGTSTTISLSGSNGDIQWQASPDGSAWANISGANSTGYVTPNLTATTHYRAAVSNAGCPTAYSTAVEVQVDVETGGAGTWLGTSSDWNTAANWQGNAVPNAIDVVIPQTANNPVINSGVAEIRALAISSCAELTVNAGAALTLSGNLTKHGDIHLLSSTDNTPIASLIDNGTISGLGTIYVNRYLVGNQWHTISFPTAVSNLPFGGFSVRKHLESSNSFENLQMGGNPVLEIMRGYSVWKDGTGANMTFSESVNTGAVSINSLTKTAGQYGWNLLGNPYPSGLDWTSVTRSNVNDAVYYWDATYNGGDYATYIDNVGVPSGTNGVIAPVQGFFVQCGYGGSGSLSNNGTGSLNVDNAARVHVSSNSYKDLETNLLRLSIRNSAGLTDEAVVRIKSQAEADFNPETDAMKFYLKHENAPKLFSYTADEIPVIVNTLPDTERVVSLALEATAGTYQISAVDISEFISSEIAYLKDLRTGKWTDLRISTGYTFEHQADGLSKRFEIHFKKDQLDSEDLISIHAFENRIYVNLKMLEIPEGEIVIYSITGKELLRQSIEKISPNVITSYLTAGNYIVKVFTKEEVISGKVFVE